MLICSDNKKVIYTLIIIIFLLLMFGGYTFSKYFSRVNGSIFSNIAIWNFKINGSTEKLQNINLFDTCDESTETNGKIAPGTSGKIKLSIDATGTDVDLDYSCNFEEKGSKPENIKFIYENKEYDNINDLKNCINGRINAGDTNKTRYIEIDWIWKYESGNSLEEIEQSDQKDTQDGINFSDYNIDITVIGKQVNT